MDLDISRLYNSIDSYTGAATMLILRALKEDEWPFILHPWRIHLRIDMPNIDAVVFNLEITKRFEAVQQSCQAYGVFSEGLLLGAIVVRRPVDSLPRIYFAYVRKTHRRMGVFKMLIKLLNIETAVTAFDPIEAQSLFVGIYNPFIFLGGIECVSRECSSEKQSSLEKTSSLLPFCQKNELN